MNHGQIHGRLAPEDGALLLRALEAMRDSLWKQACGSAKPWPTQQASKAEALVAVAEAALAHPAGTWPSGERYQVVIHGDDEAVLSHDSEGGCELEDGSALAPETARRLACDAFLVGGGRTTHTIPPAVRRVLRAAPRLPLPRLRKRRLLDAHHAHHWARGGPMTLGNLVLLCRRHHRLAHEGGWHVDRRGRFYDPRGHPFPQRPRSHAAIPTRSSSTIATSQSTTLRVGHRRGPPLHLAAAVEAVLSISSCGSSA